MATLRKTSTERLLAALRGDGVTEARQTAAVPPPQATKQSAKRAQKRDEAEIRQPKGSRALRQHIAAIQAESVPRPRLQLKINEDPARGFLTGSLPGLGQSRAFANDVSPRDGKSSSELIAVESLSKLARDTRESMSLTQAQVAAKAGTGRRFISDFEGGKSSVEFGKVLRVCQALGLTLTATGTPHDR